MENIQTIQFEQSLKEKPPKVFLEMPTLETIGEILLVIVSVFCVASVIILSLHSLGGGQ